MTNVDYLVVGSGLTGSTLARLLHDDHREVLLLERRFQPGGNVRDTLHPSQIRMHLYGPHYFRCSSRKVWDFVNRYSDFYPYEAKVKILVNGQYRQWPVTDFVVRQHPGWKKTHPAGAPANFEDACLQRMPAAVYEAYIKGYSLKQWGLDSRLLAPGLAQRIRVNPDGQTTLTPGCAFQGLPVQGYSRMMAEMIAGIPCLLGVDYLQRKDEFHARKALVFTGPIDEWFGFDAGRLGYRAHRRLHEYLPDCDQFQPCAQVNLPGADGPLRRLEWKHLLPPSAQARARGTLITDDHPFTPEDPDAFEYPVPTAENVRLYEHYRRRAAAVPGLNMCGRLGSYAYLDMDHAIEQAFGVAQDLMNRKVPVMAGARLASHP